MAKIFFSGIGGSGMSAIACFMADKGNVIVGSDRSFDRDPDNYLCKVLKEKGVTIVPQDGSGIDTSFDFAVFSTAVEDDQPEARKAGKAGIPVKTRPEYLREIIGTYETIAVGGTSGKSTTAGMLAFLMKQLNMEPNFIGGGRVKQFREAGAPGNSLVGKSDLLIVEACESDGSLIHYQPSFSLIGNLSLDHNPVDETAAMFEALGRNTNKQVIINADDRHLSRCNFAKPVRFSVDSESEYRATGIDYKSFDTTFTLRGAEFQLSLPGKYNLYNAVACIALLSEQGVDLKRIADIIPDFSGIERRFDVHLNDGTHLVIDDYAHNPHKIESLMGCTGRIRTKICYIFQPHGYGPTRLMKAGYVETFIRNLREGDHLFLLPIFYAGGTSVKDIASEDLVQEIRSAGKSAEVLPERSALFSRLGEWNTCIVFGARDESLSDFAREIAGRLI
ncbi:MAG: Mur ligase family protein [Thermodesulfovibrionales bacterium]|nr:Mur ligase family protein [Thermodesulfovibrionales bacterium]